MVEENNDKISETCNESDSLSGSKSPSLSGFIVSDTSKSSNGSSEFILKGESTSSD